MVSRNLISLGVGVITAYSGYIEFNYFYRQSKQHKKFEIGTADDTIMNSLQSGDVILSNRRWYNHHIPIAIMIKAYQILNQTEFDHCSIVVEDSIGNPNILEMSMSGYKLIPYHIFLQSSQAHQIILLPIEPRDSITSGQREKLMIFAKSLCCSTSHTSEFSIMIKYFWNAIFKLEKLDANRSYCPNVQLACMALSQLGIELTNNESSLSNVSCDDLARRRIFPKDKYYSFGSDVILRTK